MAYALGLPEALRRRGLTVELVPGWETRSAGTFNPKGAVCHWTAGPAGSKTRPSLNICTNGRSDLPGPLCNVYGARDGKAIVVAAGRANHAGTGSWKGLTGNSAVFGTEMEAAGLADFTIAQRWAYPRINAAYADLGGFGADLVCGHSEWAGPRKSDINGYPMSGMRAEVAALLANPAAATTTPTEEDMAIDEATFKTWVLQALEQKRDDRNANRNIYDSAKQIIDNQGAQAAVLNALVTRPGSATVNATDLAAALRPVVAEAVAAGMAADNDAQADDIVDEFVGRFAARLPAQG